MEQIVEHVLKELKDKLEPWQIKAELNRQIDNLLQEKEWPFKTVSREYFVDVSIPFIQMAQQIEKADTEERHKRAAEFTDRINYTSADLLTCIQKMEEDFLAQEAIRYDKEYNGRSSVADTTTLAHKVSDFGKFLLNNNNNRAIDLMQSEFSQFPRQPVRITDNMIRLYSCELARSMTTEAVNEHETAHKKNLRNAPYLLEYETKTDSLADKVANQFNTHRAQMQQMSEENLTELVEAQIKVDHIQQNVIPFLKQEAGHDVLRAILEKKARADRGEANPHSSFREASEEKLKTANECDQQIKDMYKRESEAIKGWSITITRGDDGVYSIAVQKADGEKRETKVEKDNKTYIKTAERNRKEEKLELKLTEITNRALEQTKSFRYVLGRDKETIIEPEQTPQIDTKSKKKEKDSKLLEVSASRSTTMDIKGIKTKKARAGFELFQKSGKVSSVKQVGNKEKEKTIASYDIQALGASGEIMTPNRKNIGTPTATIKAHALSGEGALGPLKMKLSAGVKATAGYQLSPEKLIAEAVCIASNELIKGSAANSTKIMDEVASFIVECLEKMPPNQKVDWGTITLAVGDFDFFKAEVKDQAGNDTHEFEVQTSSPFINDIKEDVKTLQDSAQERFPYDETVEHPVVPEPHESDAMNWEITRLPMTEDIHPDVHPDIENDEPVMRSL